MKFAPPLALAAFLSLMGANTSNATVLLYTFSPGSYYDYTPSSVNTPVTGSFNFDTISGLLSNVNYTSISGNFNTGAEYSPGDATQIYFGQFGGNYDVYQLASSLDNGGTVVINSGTHPSQGISAGGSLTTGAVPEPATWAVMLIGLCALGFALRGRRRMSLAD